MSLINEALKRAKQAQQENPPATPALEFRPVEPSQSASRRTTLLIVGMTLVVILILGLAGTLIWFVFKSDRASLPIAARVAETPLPALPSEVKPAPVPTPATEVLPAVAPATGQQFEHPDEPNTNRVPVGAEIVEAIQPPALKLQGIFFSPSHPSAVVNGKTVYLGDRVNGFRLVAVSPVAATFVSATETNVLSLSGQ